MFELGQENHNGQAVNETKDYGVGDQAHQFTQLKYTGQNLNNTRENDAGENVSWCIFNANGNYKTNNYDGDGTGCARYHTWAATKDGRNQAHHESSVEADQGVEPRDDGEGYGFRYQRQGDGDAGQDFRAVVDFLFEIEEVNINVHSGGDSGGEDEYLIGTKRRGWDWSSGIKSL